MDRTRPAARPATSAAHGVALPVRRDGFRRHPRRRRLHRWSRRAADQRTERCRRDRAGRVDRVALRVPGAAARLGRARGAPGVRRRCGRRPRTDRVLSGDVTQPHRRRRADHRFRRRRASGRGRTHRRRPPGRLAAPRDRDSGSSRCVLVTGAGSETADNPRAGRAAGAARRGHLRALLHPLSRGEPRRIHRVREREARLERRRGGRRTRERRVVDHQASRARA